MLELLKVQLIKWRLCAIKLCIRVYIGLKPKPAVHWYIALVILPFVKHMLFKLSNCLGHI